MENTTREQRAIMIAATSKLTRKGDTWIVPSQAGAQKYLVDPNPDEPYCSCPDFELRLQPCKHIFAVEIVVKREYSEVNDSRTFTETVTVKKTYKQDWSNYNKA